MDAIIKDLRFAVRSLSRQPGSALLSVFILALGIGLSTFMFSLIYGVFFRGLDVPHSGRIYVLERVDTRDGGQGGTAIPSQDVEAFRERTRSFDELAAYYGGTVNLSDEVGPERYQGLWAHANLFELLGVEPVLGRTFVAGEDRPGSPPAVLLGHHVWRERYGGDPDIVGRTVRVNGRQGTVVGVMPEGFRFPSDHDVWIAMDDDPLATAHGEGRWYTVMVRLADGVSRDEANLDVGRVATQLAAEHGEADEGLGARLLTISEQQNGEEIALVFSAMMVAVLCVLLVACANVANLLLARAASRTREAGLRVAIGAGRLRVMLPFLTEALVLAFAGAVLGTVLAFEAVHLFDRATATALTGRPYFVEFRVDLPVLLYTVGITGLTALVAGLAPALQVARADVNGILKDEARGSSSFHLGRLSKGLVMVEVALSVALLVGAGLMTKSIVLLSRHELPFESGRYIGGRIGLFETDYPERSDRQAFWREVEQRVAALPEVETVALTSSLPGTGTGAAAIRLEGAVYDEPSDRPTTHFEMVSPGYFDALGARLIEGEGFGPQHTMDGERVAIVNRSFAERFWPGGSPLGRRFRTGTADTVTWMTVIGVAPDLQMEGFQPAGSPGSIPDGFYVPITQTDPSFLSVVAHPRAGAPVELAPLLRDAVRALDPDLPLYDLQPLDEAIREDSWFYSVFGSVFIAFGLAALFMASAGLYGVLSFSVSRRTQEMGIRMALGAESRQVVRLILRQGVAQVGIGLLVGLGLAALVSRVVHLLMFQVDPRDPAVFGGVVALILLVGLAAGLVPAVRATRVDPIVALRTD